jgi:deoxyadenosine/deoxycytidine kinase
MKAAEKLFISLEGCIGVGKSTMLSLLPEYLFKIKEPVHLYSSFKTHNPLDLLYLDPVRNSPLAQLHIMRSCHAWYNSRFEDSFCPLVVSERSITSTAVFVDTLADSGIFSPFTRDFLQNEISSMLSNPKCARPDNYIYLAAKPEMCFERIKARSKTSGHDEEIPLSYLQSLCQVHDKFFRNRADTFTINVGENVSREELLKKTESIVLLLWDEFKQRKKCSVSSVQNFMQS